MSVVNRLMCTVWESTPYAPSQCTVDIKHVGEQVCVLSTVSAFCWKYVMLKGDRSVEGVAKVLAC